jgi:outer membrane protein OmpA-like peptidoglycan-associated protein
MIQINRPRTTGNEEQRSISRKLDCLIACLCRSYPISKRRAELEIRAELLRVGSHAASHNARPPERRRMKFASLCVVLLAIAPGAASAQDVIATGGTDWRGFYAGVNIGGAWNRTCNSWTPNGPIVNPTIANAFYNRDCPNNGVFIGGAQIGYNFQYEQIVWGFGLDYDIWSAKNHNRSFTYTGPTPPPDGTYNFFGKVSPNGFALLGPRIGYAVDGGWLPYVRVGGVFTGGSHHSTASFTDANGTASFSGGKNFNSSGFGAGVGLDYQMVDAWFLRAEFTHVSLGKGTNSVTTCTGSAAACTEFANISLDNIHNSLTANIFRVGINYKFGGKSEPAPVAAAPPPPPPPTPPPPPAPPPCNAPAGFKVDANCQIIEQSVVVRAVDFEYNSARLTTPAQQTLDEVASALKTQPTLHVEIQGHTDSTGSDAYNLSLSQRRADAVLAYLTSRQVSASALTAKGYGKTQPIASNATAEGRAENRRVAFEVTNVPAHVNVVTKDASAASTEAAEQGTQPKPKH